MTARRGRVAFVLFVAVAAIGLLVAWLGGAGSRRSAEPYPSWADLPAPGALGGVMGLAPCALGAKVPSALVPVVAFSGAAEEWCARNGLQVVAFDGPGLPVLAHGLGVTAASRVTGAIGTRHVYGVLWARPYGWVAALVWGDPGVPASIEGVLDALQHAEAHVAASP